MITDDTINNTTARLSAMRESSLHDMIDRLQTENELLRREVEQLRGDLNKANELNGKLIDKIWRMKRLAQKERKHNDGRA